MSRSQMCPSNNAHIYTIITKKVNTRKKVIFATGLTKKKGKLLLKIRLSILGENQTHIDDR